MLSVLYVEMRGWGIDDERLVMGVVEVGGGAACLEKTGMIATGGRCL